MELGINEEERNSWRVQYWALNLKRAQYKCKVVIQMLEMLSAASNRKFNQQWWMESLGFHSCWHWLDCSVVSPRRNQAPSVPFLLHN
jgi:hypothetical protein